MYITFLNSPNARIYPADDKTRNFFHKTLVSFKELCLSLYQLNKPP